MGSFLPTFFFFYATAVPSVSLERSSRNPPEADLWTRKSLSIFHGLTFDLAFVSVRMAKFFFHQVEDLLEVPQLSSLLREIRINFFLLSDLTICEKRSVTNFRNEIIRIENVRRLQIELSVAESSIRCHSGVTFIEKRSAR